MHVSAAALTAQLTAKLGKLEEKTSSSSSSGGGTGSVMGNLLDADWFGSSSSSQSSSPSQGQTQQGGWRKQDVLTGAPNANHLAQFNSLENAALQNGNNRRLLLVVCAIGLALLGAAEAKWHAYAALGAKIRDQRQEITLQNVQMMEGAACRATLVKHLTSMLLVVRLLSFAFDSCRFA